MTECGMCKIAGSGECYEHEVERLRKALGHLSSAAYDVVQRNRQIYMSGTKYTTPTIQKLAEAMYEANKALDAEYPRSPQAIPEEK